MRGELAQPTQLFAGSSFCHSNEFLPGASFGFRLGSFWLAACPKMLMEAGKAHCSSPWGGARSVPVASGCICGLSTCAHFPTATPGLNADQQPHGSSLLAARLEGADRSLAPALPGAAHSGDQLKGWCLQAACCLSFGGELSVSTDKSWGLHLCSCSPPGGGLWVEVYANHVLLMSDGKCDCPPCALKRQAEDRESQSPSSLPSGQKNIWKTTSKVALSVVNEKTQAVVNEKTQAPLDCDNSADRIPHKPSIIIVRAWSSGGPRFHHRRLCATGTTDSTFSGLLQVQGTSSAAASCSLKMEASCCVLRLLCCVEDTATGLLPGTVTMETPTKVARPTQTSSHSHSLPPGTPRTPSFMALQSGSEILPPPTQHPPVAILAQNSDNSMNPVLDCSLEMEARAPPNLGFRVHMASGEALCLMMDFGDSSGVEMRLHNMSEAMAVTAYHQYSKEGVYMLKAVIYNEFHGTKVELGPYYVEIGREAVSAFMNSSSVHEDEVLVFTDSQVNQKSAVVVHHFPSIPSYNVSFISQTQVGDSQAWHSMTVWYRMQSVSVYTNGTVFATDTDITFTAITKETIPLEFEWYFGEDPPVRTTSRSIKKRLSIPQWSVKVAVLLSNCLYRSLYSVCRSPCRY
ncbi:hypothetical protein H8959_008006 [Pygathrix nigripes]